jgi:hypothetical protein
MKTENPANQKGNDKTRFCQGLLWFTGAFFLTLPIPFSPSWYDNYIYSLLHGEGIGWCGGYSSERGLVFVVLWLSLCVVYRKYLIKFLVVTFFLHSVYYNCVLYYYLGDDGGYCELTPPEYIIPFAKVIC